MLLFSPIFVSVKPVYDPPLCLCAASRPADDADADVITAVQHLCLPQQHRHFPSFQTD